MQSWSCLSQKGQQIFSKEKNDARGLYRTDLCFYMLVSVSHPWAVPYPILSFPLRSFVFSHFTYLHLRISGGQTYTHANYLENPHPTPGSFFASDFLFLQFNCYNRPKTPSMTPGNITDGESHDIIQNRCIVNSHVSTDKLLVEQWLWGPHSAGGSHQLSHITGACRGARQQQPGKIP